MGDAGTTTLIFGEVIGTILCDYALTLVSSLLNYRALDQPLPAEFSGVYEPAAYARSQAYTKAKSVHSLLHGSFDLAVMLLSGSSSTASSASTSPCAPPCPARRHTWRCGAVRVRVRELLTLTLTLTLTFTLTLTLALTLTLNSRWGAACCTW